jgi:hypothetical protein
VRRSFDDRRSYAARIREINLVEYLSKSRQLILP